MESIEKKVAVLCARGDSIYKDRPECDVFDAERDAFTFPGNLPVIAHPPCRGWGRLRKMAKAGPVEKALGLWTVTMVRECGGVLEHPAQSSLFKQMGMPRPGQGPDLFGGWTYSLPQFWFGHRAEKPTWLYICGVNPADLPETPIVIGRPTHGVTNRKGIRKAHNDPRWRPSIRKEEREATPPSFADWLIDLAMRSVDASKQRKGP